MPDTNMPSQTHPGNALIPIAAGTIGDFGFTQDVDFVAGNFLPGSMGIPIDVLMVAVNTRKNDQRRTSVYEE